MPDTLYACQAIHRSEPGSNVGSTGSPDLDSGTDQGQEQPLDRGAQLVRHRQVWQASEEDLGLDDSSLKRLRSVVPVALTPRCELQEYEVVDLQTPRNRGSVRPGSRWNRAPDQALLPAARLLRRLGSHAVGVVTERRVKLGPVSEARVDQVGRLRRPDRVDVGLHRLKHRCRGLVHGAEDRLTPDDYELVLPGHLSRRGDEVLELLQAH